VLPIHEEFENDCLQTTKEIRTCTHLSVKYVVICPRHPMLFPLVVKAFDKSGNVVFEVISNQWVNKKYRY
jgi:hypothetical protein